MKRNFIYQSMWLVTLMFMALTGAGCSDENIDAFLNLPEEQQAVSIYRAGGSYAVDIQTNQHWEAQLDKTADWLILLNREGEGSQSIQLMAEHNYGYETRHAVLTIKAGGIKKEIPITQSYLPEGQNAPDNANLVYFDNATTKGLGRGFDIRTMKLKNPVLATNGIKKASKDKDLYSEQYLSQSDFIVTDLDSLIDKTDTLSVDDAHIGISFGLFKLDINAFYKSTEKAGGTTIRYHSSVSMPKCLAEVHLTNIVSCYENAQEDEKRLYLSSGFANYRSAIIECIEKNSNSTQLDELLKTLDEYYGATVVIGSTLGGEMSLVLDTDSTIIGDYLKAGGSVRLAIKGFFEAGVGVTYQKAGEEIMNHTNLMLQVKGGDPKKISELIRYLTKSHQLSASEIHAYQTAWGNSIDANTNAEIISWNLKGIWNLFPLQHRSKIKAWFCNQYKDCKTYNIQNLN